MRNSIPVNEEEFKDWEEHPCTKALFTLLADEAKVRRDWLAQGYAREGKTLEEVAQIYLRFIDQAIIYEDISTSVTYELLFPIEETNEDSSSGTESID
jgi:hypothetical protein